MIRLLMCIMLLIQGLVHHSARSRHCRCSARIMIAFVASLPNKKSLWGRQFAVFLNEGGHLAEAKEIRHSRGDRRFGSIAVVPSDTKVMNKRRNCMIGMFQNGKLNEHMRLPFLCLLIFGTFIVLHEANPAVYTRVLSWWGFPVFPVPFIDSLGTTGADHVLAEGDRRLRHRPLRHLRPPSGLLSALAAPVVSPAKLSWNATSRHLPRYSICCIARIVAGVPGAASALSTHCVNPIANCSVCS